MGKKSSRVPRKTAGGRALPAGLRDLLRQRRLSLDWSLARAGEETGISGAHLSLIELGRRIPRLEAAKQLSEALDLDAPSRDALLSAVVLAHGGADSEREQELLRSGWERVLDNHDLEVRPVDASQVRVELAGAHSATASEHDQDQASFRGQEGHVSVPLLREGDLPTARKKTIGQVRLSPEVLPPSERLDELFAWKLMKLPLTWVSDLLRPGDVLLVAACTGDSLPERLRPSDVWVLRHAKRITLARIQHGGPRGGVLLLPTRESRGDVERVPSRAVIGRVVAAIRT
ncbi:MAG: helix-turn-helix transcriptional regulator [Planctomycetes bacterium]|nr:helix-turn-helix transcriptional regulator [Planctomycetota bacterium]